jgi:RNA polymerase-interacting CarD/CdnL/TRCF family regulator
MPYYSIGEWVVHPLHGLGQVMGLGRQQFAQTPAQSYYEIAIRRGTIWVAADTPLAGLRGVTAKGDLPRYRTVLKSSPGLLDKHYHQRRGELQERLKQGTFQVKCEVVRDLTAYGWPRRLGEVDSAMLRRARESLCQEWAAAEAVTVAEATQEVEALLHEAQQVYQK